MDTLSLHDKIGQMLVVGFEGLTAPEHILTWLREGRIGGVILFQRNIDSPAQLAALTQSLHAAARYPCVISIDQEGGTVARLRAGFTESPGAMALSVGDDEHAAESVSRVLGAELHALGINWNYAPVVDITYNRANPSVGTRAYGTDAARVSRFAAAAVRGFQAAGVAACAKHFPGLGDTPIDTHVALPTLTRSVETLLREDLPPYRAVMEADIASIMVTHARFAELDPQHAATVSPVVVNQLLRDTLGYDGLVTTDCMEMKAIADNYGAGESAVLAALAGIDVILFSHTRSAQEEAYDALLEAAQSGRLPMPVIDAANARIAAFKARYPASAPNLTQIRTVDSLNTVKQAARAGTVLLHNEGALPLTPDSQAVVIEFASVLESGIMESGGLTGLASLVQQRAPNIPTVSLRSVGDVPQKYTRALELAQNTPLVVIVTRNAHLIAEQQTRAQQLIDAAQGAVLVCLRNPYDTGALHGARAILCTNGDSTPSLQAAVDALFGEFTPRANFPFRV